MAISRHSADGRSTRSTRRRSAGILAATSTCFDLSVFEIFATLAAVVLAESAFALPSLAHHDAVTMINTVPSVMSELIRLAPVPPSLRVVDLAGERLSLELARGRSRRYGPT